MYICRGVTMLPAPTALFSLHVLSTRIPSRQYDRELCKRPGTYYTPPRLVKEMVRFTDAVLRTHLGCVEGFADEQVTIVKPAMGPGTLSTGSPKKAPAAGRFPRRST